jgi:hypothetical protein
MRDPTLHLLFGGAPRAVPVDARSDNKAGSCLPSTSVEGHGPSGPCAKHTPRKIAGL